MKQIPKELLKSKYRKYMCNNSIKIIKKIEKILPITSAYLLGSFTTKKRRPADVDFIILLNTKTKTHSKWSVDLVISPDNNYGKYIVNDADKWMKSKYGKKNSMCFKLK